MLPRIPEWWEPILGLMRLGAIPIPCTTLLTPKDIQFRSDIAEAVAIVTDYEGAAKFDQVRADCPTIKYAILTDAVNADTAGREGWTSYQQIVTQPSPESPCPKPPTTTPS